MTTITLRRPVTVSWGECDPAGIVFNPRFFHMFDTSTWMLFEAALGLRPPELSPSYDIMGIPLVGAKANFIKAVKFGDAIEILSRVSEFRRSSFDIEHKISVKGELAVDGQETRVWTVRHPDNPDKIRAAEIPAEVIAKFG